MKSEPTFIEILLAALLILITGIVLYQISITDKLDKRVKTLENRSSAIVCADRPDLAIRCTLLPNRNVKVEYGDKWKK